MLLKMMKKKRMFDWNLAAKTILHVDDWKELFDKANYAGDFYWFTPCEALWTIS